MDRAPTDGGNTMSDFRQHWGPACAPTREEHDAIVAMRGRPYTCDGMRQVAHRADIDANPSLIDTYINDTKGTP
jgi:hypothetical protein